MGVLILGSTGMLGSYLKRCIPDAICLDRDRFDALEPNFQLLREIVVRNEINYIVNCIGLIRQRKSSKVNMIRINSIFPHLLHHNIGRLCVVVHISTDCVFDGADGPYRESDPISEDIDDYGSSKAAGECPGLMIIRTSIVGEENRNKLSFFEFVKRETILRGWIDHMWNGVTCLELSKIISRLILNKIRWEGVRHVFSPTPLTKYELIVSIDREWGLGKIVVPYETETPCSRVLGSIYEPLCTTEIKQQLHELRVFT